MGSSFTVVLYGNDRDRLTTAADAALDEARRLDHLLSNYQTDSEWSRINREAADHPVAVSSELFDLLSACLNYSRLSDGAFDISVGPLMKTWGFYRGTGSMPELAKVHAAVALVGSGNIRLDRAARTVRFLKSGVELDPGGIGKGYAVDRMTDILKSRGIATALVSAAGSSIYCLGIPPAEAPGAEPGWRVQIRDPRNPGRYAAQVVLRDESLSTSGSSEKFFVAEGSRWAHIMDPRTGFPSRGALSVSVIAPRTLDSEAWAKPYFINGRQWTAAHKPGNYRVFYCEDKADQQCAWLP